MFLPISPFIAPFPFINLVEICPSPCLFCPPLLFETREYTHNQEKQNSESFFNYDANLTSVITMELKFFFSLRCWFFCMTSLAVRSSMLKTSVKLWDTSFKFWLRPCRSKLIFSFWQKQPLIKNVGNHGWLRMKNYRKNTG